MQKLNKNYILIFLSLRIYKRDPVQNPQPCLYFPCILLSFFSPPCSRDSDLTNAERVLSHLDHMRLPPNPRLAPSPNLLTQTSILYYFWLTTSFSKSFPCKAFQIYLPLLILCQLSDSDVQRAQDLSD